MRDLVVAGFIAALGLTVALFVASAAYIDPGLQGQAKMGALLSGAVGLVAVPLARLLGIRKFKRDKSAAPGALPEALPALEAIVPTDMDGSAR